MSDAFTQGSVAGRPSSDTARLRANPPIFSSSLGDPTVPASFTRQLPRNQEFAMDTTALLCLGRLSLTNILENLQAAQIAFNILHSAIGDVTPSSLGDAGLALGEEGDGFL